MSISMQIVAIRGERGSYNMLMRRRYGLIIVAIRGERGSYNSISQVADNTRDCSYPG